MRKKDIDQLRGAAVAAGLEAEAFMPAPKRESRTMPEIRVEYSVLAERYSHSPRLIKKTLPAEDNATHCTHRVRHYTVDIQFMVRVCCDSEEWLDSFTPVFERALPRKFADDANNVVTARIEKAELGGFSSELVTVFKKLSRTYHITFRHLLTEDIAMPLIRDVSINPHIQEA